MPSLVNRYPDLLPTLDDPVLNRLVTDLDRAYSPENPLVAIPSELHGNLAATLSRHAMEQAPQAPRRRRVTHRRSGIAAILVAALLGGGTAALALTGRSEYPRFYPPAPAFAEVLYRYGHAIYAAHEGCGYNVTVSYSYADANRILVAMTIQGPAGRHFVALTGSSALSLSTAGGHHLQWLDASHLREMDGSLGRTVHDLSTLYGVFDAHPVVHGTTPLHLTLTLPSFSLVEQLDGWSFKSSTCERYSGAAWFQGADASLLDRLRAVGARLLPGLFSSPVGRTVNIDAGYTISFTVPVDPVRAEIHLNQAVGAGGVTLILDHVIATRSEIRVYLRRARAGHILEGAALELRGDNAANGATTGVPLFGDYWRRVAPASRQYDFSFPDQSYQSHARYTLVVRPDSYQDFPGQPWRSLHGGPWTFHFTLP